MTGPHQPVVFRQLAIPVSTFDRIKDYQRSHEARNGERLTIAQTVAAIVREHQSNEEREAHEKASNRPSYGGAKVARKRGKG